jgi:pimeloyl-ACP methyl ester carboxylesterase
MRFEDWPYGRVSDGEANLFYRRFGSGHPVVLVHGCPQHSLMWHAIGPALSHRFDVIAYDQRGMGMSSITRGGYDGSTLGRDLHALLDALGVDKAHLVGYDLGAQTVASFAREHPDRVGRAVFMEYALAGFGYEQAMAPQPDWSLNSNWHLSLFTVPDAAEFLVRGREREMLSWWFHHAAYSGDVSMSRAHFDSYARALEKPGGLRACIEHYATVWQDAEDNAALRAMPLGVPALAMGGEASLGPWLEACWKDVAKSMALRVIPRAGHWISEENTEFTAAALVDFLAA